MAAPQHPKGVPDPEAEDRSEIVREISLDAFNPSGTLALLAVYFLILLGMWIFMYFVEFAGRGVSITG